MTISTRCFPAFRIGLVRTIVSLLSLLPITGCYPQVVAGPEDAPPPLVEVLELQELPVVEKTTLIGVTEPWREATLYFEVSGVVEDVFVEEGQEVEPNAPVAQLVVRDYELALALAEAELAAAQARLAMLRAGTRKEDVLAAEADHAKARNLTGFWKSEWQRVAKLYEISESERAHVRSKYDVALQDEQAAQWRWAKAAAGFRQEEIEEAQAQFVARQQQVAMAQRNLEKATLRAPFRGRIEKRLLDPGAYINLFPTGGAPVTHIVDLEQVDALFDVPEVLLIHCHSDTPLNVASAANPQIRGQARVVSIGRVADRGSGTYALRARLQNDQQHFQAGMTVTAELTTSSASPAIHVPLAAVGRAYGQPPYVLLVDRESNQVVAREVQLGAITGESIQVTAGLKPGNLLIVRGQDRILPGEHVRYRPLAPIAEQTGERIRSRNKTAHGDPRSARVSDPSLFGAGLLVRRGSLTPPKPPTLGLPGQFWYGF